MKTARVDLLLIHRPDPFMDHHETGKALDALVASGKVRNVGVSNFKLTDWTMLQSAMSTKLCTNQVELSVLHHSPFIEGDIQWMQERGIHPVMGTNTLERIKTFDQALSVPMDRQTWFEILTAAQGHEVP